MGIFGSKVRTSVENRLISGGELKLMNERLSATEISKIYFDYFDSVFNQNSQLLSVLLLLDFKQIDKVIEGAK